VQIFEKTCQNAGLDGFSKTRRGHPEAQATTSWSNWHHDCLVVRKYGVNMNIISNQQQT
jgi:hypothetical protein